MLLLFICFSSYLSWVLGCEFKIYAGTDRCPIRMYKEYARGQPSVSPESRFYLHPVKLPRTKFWFTNELIGKNNIFAIAKNMAKACSILDKKTNHSARKMVIRMLLHEKVSLTDVIQITGHKNIQSLNACSSMSFVQQETVSRMI